MTTDYKVRYRSYSDVAASALALRELIGVGNSFNFNIVDKIQRLIGKHFGDRGELHLDIFEHDDVSLASVTFRPLTLHVHREIWNLAKLGEPKSRFILAHELGHMVMHQHYVQAYSEDEKSRLKSVRQEESAESQANWFAACFLAPDHLARRCKNELELCFQFDFPEAYASFRRELLKKNSPKYSGEACAECGNFTVAGNKNCMTCYSCGTSYVL